MEPKVVKYPGKKETLAAAAENKQRALSTWNTIVSPHDINTVKMKLDDIMKPRRGDNYALIGESNFSCQHTCPKGIYGSTQGTLAYGEIVANISATREYICSCKNQHNEDCKLSLWFCNEVCPFTMFEKHALNQGVEPSPLAVGWKNPIVFKGQVSGRELIGVIGEHVKGLWHCFWHAVSEFTKSGSKQTMIQPADYHALAQMNKYRITRDLFAFYAMANYQLDDQHVEVDCEVNDFIRKNAQHFQNAEKFLKQVPNPWIPRYPSGNRAAFEDFIQLQPATYVIIMPAIYAFGQTLFDNTLNTPKGKHIIQVIHKMYGDTLVAKKGITPKTNTLQGSGHKHTRAGEGGASLALEPGPATAAHAKVQKTIMSETEQNRMRDAFLASQNAVLDATRVCSAAEASSQQYATEAQEAMRIYNSAVVKRDASQATWQRALKDLSQKTRLHTPLHDAYTKMNTQERLETTQPPKPPEPGAAKTGVQTETHQQSEVSVEGTHRAETTQRETDTPQRTAASTLMMLLQDTSLHSPTSTTRNKTP